MKRSLRLLADKHIYLLEETVPDSVELHVFDPDQGVPQDAGNYDALLIRTVTKVDIKSLPVTGNLKWVGTASAGYDHIDITWLSKNGVAMGFAAGCNARAVAEYVLSTAIYTAKMRGWRFEGKKLGIVGVGFVGTTLANMASKMGIEVVAYDPPRAERDANFTTSSLEEVLDCDVLSLHTPLVESGPLATRGWLDSIKLSMRNRTLLIQASRGGVADEAAVLSALRNGDLQDAVIDVWQDEPRVNRQLLDLAVVGTPHIAGYSNRAKRLATELAIADMFRCLVGGAAIHPDQVERPPLLLAEPPKAKVDLLLESEHDLLPIPLIDDFLDYDKSLRNTLRTANIADQIAEFRRLRTKLPYRDEFRDVNGLLFPSGKWPLLDVFREI